MSTIDDSAVIFSVLHVSNMSVQILTSTSVTTIVLLWLFVPHICSPLTKTNLPELNYQLISYLFFLLFFFFSLCRLFPLGLRVAKADSPYTSVKPVNTSCFPHVLLYHMQMHPLWYCPFSFFLAAASQIVCPHNGHHHVTVQSSSSFRQITYNRQPPSLD